MEAPQFITPDGNWQLATPPELGWNRTREANRKRMAEELPSKIAQMDILPLELDEAA